MSLDNFQLSSYLIQELYNDSLIDLEKEQLTEQSLNTDAIQHLGQFQQSVLILTHYPGIAFLPDETLQFLLGILQACRLSMADVAIINLAHHPDARFQLLNEQFQPKYWLGFNQDLSQLEFPVQFPDYQVQQYNHQTFLVAPALETIQADAGQKRQLWNALKKAFQIN
jgi:DNA polymerase III psi subunit